MKQVEIDEVPQLSDDRLRVIWDCSVGCARIVGQYGYPDRAKFYRERAAACEEEARKRGLELASQ